MTADRMTMTVVETRTDGFTQVYHLLSCLHDSRSGKSIPADKKAKDNGDLSKQCDKLLRALLVMRLRMYQFE